MSIVQTVFDSLDTRNNFFLRHERSIFWTVAAGLLASSLFIHSWKLGSDPPGFYTDECANAYNAWCIGQTGADEYGIRYPIFFRCLDDYRDPLMVYPIVPLVKVFGLSQGVARLPNAFSSILAAIAFVFLVQQFCRNRWLSVLSGFCFSILPWTFLASRTITSGYIMMLLGMTTGILMLFVAMERQHYSQAVAAAAGWAFAMYSCHIGRPMTALFLICFGVAYFRQLKTEWRLGLVFLITLLGMLTPMAVSVAHTPEILVRRFQAISIFQDHPTWGEAFFRLASRYAGYFNPQFLFFKGDHNLHWHTGIGGELFRFLIPMILTGVYCVVRFWKDDLRYHFVGLGLLVYPIAATLTENPMHSARSIDGAILWVLTAAIGAQFLWERRRIGRTILLIACGVGMIEMGIYLTDFFGPYQERYRLGLYSGYTEALKDSFSVIGPDETVYISGAPSALSKPGYVYILFFGKIDPHVYQWKGIPAERVRLYDGTIPRPGILLRASRQRAELAYNFNLPGDAAASRPVLFEDNKEPVPLGATLLKTVPVGNLFQYEIYRVK